MSIMKLKFCIILFLHLALNCVAQQATVAIVLRIYIQALNATSDEIIVCTSNVTSCGYDNSDRALTNCPMFRLNDSCMISLNVDTVVDCELQTTSDTSESCENFLSSYNNETIIIAIAVIFVLCVIITALITFILTCVCMKRKYKRAYANHSKGPQGKTSYETVDHTGGTITKNDLELHPNPAYGSGSKMTMDSNPAYKNL